MPGEAEDADATQANATEAASPRALAVAPSNADLHPSAWVTSSHRTPAPTTTAAAALHNSDLQRSRVFHTFGVVAPLGAIVFSLMIGGDRTAQHVFWVGAIVLSVLNIGLVWLTSRPERYDETTATVLWMGATVSAQTAIYYFGPFSAVVMVDILGIMFIALGRKKVPAIATTCVCIAGHVGIAIPITLGVMDDRGVLSSGYAGRSQLWFAEALIVSFLVSSYLLGRWARRTNANALAELHDALRVIGDQQQALAEVNDAEARQKRAAEGRWTNQVLGGYRMGVVLGRGAMGEVYEAVGPANEQAAVKLLDVRAAQSPGLVERFHREMQVALRLESPFIVKVLAVSPADAAVPFIAMERLQGTDLAKRLRTENRLPSDELVLMLDQVARGLEVARVAGVVHRDLKPHNLFHHDLRTWKILDFGVSKVMDSEGTLTGEGIVGTPQYMAPEQASGGHVTHLADVYALGAIAYRCLTGRSPFKGKDIAELVYQVVHQPPQRPSQLGRVSIAVEDVLAVAMAKDPRRRFSSALAFAQAFIAARRNKPMDLDPPSDAWRDV
ncbi:MAG: serine/threonine-protein kinase [Deltaproteobacteria bacterium]